MTGYFVRQRDKTYGPLTGTTIRELVVSGKLHAEDLVANSKDGRWVSANGIKGLKASFLAAQRSGNKVNDTANHFLPASELDDSTLPALVIKHLKTFAAPGVLCQWAPDGIYQFPAAKAVVNFSPDGGFAFFADSPTGIPITELEIAPKVPRDGSSHSPPGRNPQIPSQPAHQTVPTLNTPQPETIIGIDLGTTNSVVAVMEGTEAKVIPSLLGNHLVPSVVAYNDRGETLVGEPAHRQWMTNPGRTVYSIKRFMGRRHNEVENQEKMVPYRILGGDSDYVKIKMDNQQLTPQEFSAKILRSLKESAEAYLGHAVNKAVITTPAYFNDSQRHATKDACRIAGLEVARIINEPTAAALAYGLGKKTEEKIIVFDLGGGSCDVSALEIDGLLEEVEGTIVFEVISTSGDTQLGGDDFREALVDFVVNDFRSSTGIDLQKTAAVDTLPMARLREACEAAKIVLSDSLETVIHLPHISLDSGNPIHLEVPVTRQTYEQLTQGLIARCQVVIERVLRDANLMANDIDKIILIGGTTRAPHIREMVQSIFDKEPHFDVNPMEAVAIGAAIQGAVLAGDRTDVLLLDVTPLTLGIETEGGVMTSLVDRNTTIPTEKKQTFSTAADNQAAVTVRVFQGERKLVEDNIFLAEMNLEGIPLAPRGEPQIEVTFDIDHNGILNVSASDVGTGKAVKVRCEKSGGLSDRDIERMRGDEILKAGTPPA